MKIIYNDGHVAECPAEEELEVLRHSAAHIMAQAVKRIYPDVVRVFIEPPSWEVLVGRLRGRGTEDEASFRLRLEDARHELDLAPTYDVRIVNDDLQTAVRELADTFESYERYGGTSNNGNH